MSKIYPIELYDFLKSKNIKYLYFACTVKTACTFINRGKLMSKYKLSLNKAEFSKNGNIENDKAAGLWNKIIFNFCDLHGYFIRQNKLGPVCFVLDVDFLTEVHQNDLMITQKNPLHWKKGLKKSDFYFSSITDFSNQFSSLNEKRKIHKNMVLIRDKKTKIPLDKYLVEIILDKPGDRYLLFTKAKKALLNAIESANLKNVSFKIRKCKNFCYCQSNYTEMPEHIVKELFNP